MLPIKKAKGCTNGWPCPPYVFYRRHTQHQQIWRRVQQVSPFQLSVKIMERQLPLSNPHENWEATLTYLLLSCPFPSFVALEPTLACHLLSLCNARWLIWSHVATTAKHMTGNKPSWLFRQGHIQARGYTCTYPAWHRPKSMLRQLQHSNYAPVPVHAQKLCKGGNEHA